MKYQLTTQGGWIRLWANGPGLSFLHRSCTPLFSERNGHRRYWPKWPALWRFRFLPSLKREPCRHLQPEPYPWASWARKVRLEAQGGSPMDRSDRYALAAALETLTERR